MPTNLNKSSKMSDLFPYFKEKVRFVPTLFDLSKICPFIFWGAKERPNPEIPKKQGKVFSLNNTNNFFLLPDRFC